MTSHSNTLVGWREWVSLPDAGIDWIKAKIDTGARTSSLHAFDIEAFEREGEDWVRFRVNPWQNSDADSRIVECPVHDRRSIRSSSGHSEERIVVLLAIRLVGRLVVSEVTLSNRDEMGFRMLIGREALRRGFIVDPARSFLGPQARMSTVPTILSCRPRWSGSQMTAGMTKTSRAVRMIGRHSPTHRPFSSTMRIPRMRCPGLPPIVGMKMI